MREIELNRKRGVKSDVQERFRKRGTEPARKKHHLTRPSMRHSTATCQEYGAIVPRIRQRNQVATPPYIGTPGRTPGRQGLSRDKLPLLRDACKSRRRGYAKSGARDHLHVIAAGTAPLQHRPGQCAGSNTGARARNCCVTGRPGAVTHSLPTCQFSRHL